MIFENKINTNETIKTKYKWRRESCMFNIVYIHPHDKIYMKIILTHVVTLIAIQYLNML